MPERPFLGVTIEFDLAIMRDVLGVVPGEVSGGGVFATALSDGAVGASIAAMIVEGAHASGIVEAIRALRQGFAEPIRRYPGMVVRVG